MSTAECYKCKIEFGEEEKYFECDGCSATWHLKCAGVTKQEANARDKSNRIRLLCDECNTTDPINVVANNMKTVLKFVYKMDMTLQQQVVANADFKKTITTHTEEIKRMEEKINMLKCDVPVLTIGNENANRMMPASASTSVMRRSNILPSVVIRPINNEQTCEATLKKVRECIGATDSDMLVRNTQNIRGGGVVLSCANACDTMKVKQLVYDNAANEYDVRLPEIKGPRVRISQINADMSTDEIINDILQKNENMSNAKIEIKKVMKKNLNETKDIIAEVDARSFEIMMMTKKLFIGWNCCKVDEHVYLKRCFKCCGFSHIEKECKRDVACSKCAGSHKSVNCSSRSFGCVNCMVANQQYGLNLPTEHHAWSRNCTVLQKRISKLKEYIQYNPTE